MRISKRPIQRATSRRAALVGAALIGALVTGAIVLRSHGRDDHRAAIDPVSVKAIRTRPHAVVPRTLTSRPTGRLDAPLQDAAAVSLGGSRAMLLGGLTAADTSTDAVNVISHTGDRATGRLPTAVHDAAAARLGRSVYLFGGGDGARQHDEIVRVGGGIARPAAGPELGPGRRRDRRHGVHRRRLHRDALARHHRRVVARAGREDRRPSAHARALRGRHVCGRQAHRRRRVSAGRGGELQGVRVHACRAECFGGSDACPGRQRMQPRPRLAVSRT